MRSKYFTIYIFILATIFMLYQLICTDTNIFSDINLFYNHDNIRNEQLIRNLSILLNDATKKIGKLSCKVSNNNVSLNGGWCARLSGENSEQHMTDFSLADSLSRFLAGKRVASFGDGPGIYKDTFTVLNQVKVYDAFDGAPYVEETTNNRVKYLDLSVPVYHLNKYDWVISLEVAEHIPRKYESIYIDNLVRYAIEGIVISWAKVGQGGLSHVNTRDFPYIKKQMESRGFKYDAESSKYLRKKALFSWFQENLSIFKRANSK